MRTLSLFPAYSTCRSFAQAEESDFFIPVSRVDETAEFYRIEIDVPGLKKDELKIETDNHLLTVQGERKDRYKVQKRFNLPDDVELDGIQAKHEDGVLYLELPKVAQVKPRAIAIK